MKIADWSCCSIDGPLPGHISRTAEPFTVNLGLNDSSGSALQHDTFKCEFGKVFVEIRSCHLWHQGVRIADWSCCSIDGPSAGTISTTTESIAVNVGLNDASGSALQHDIFKLEFGQVFVEI